MNIQELLPTELPNLDFKVNHKKWQKALLGAYTHISMSDPGSVVCVVGPSGVGKSRLPSLSDRCIPAPEYCQRTPQHRDGRVLEPLRRPAERSRHRRDC